MKIAAHNEAIEQAALIADAEAARLKELAADIQRQIATAPRLGLKWRQAEYMAGACVARRIAMSIRQQKVSEEEG
jgi:hypothetical protein